MKIDKLIRPGEFINLRLRFGVGRALFRAFLLVISTALAAAVLVKYTGWIDWGEGLTFLTLSVLLAFVMLVYWLRAGVILTNQRLLEQKGAIGAVVNEIELSEIKDFIVLHNYFGRPANLKIQMTDDDVYTIEDVSGMDGLGNALAVAINKPPAKYQTNRLFRAHGLITVFLTLCSLAAGLGIFFGAIALLNLNAQDEGLDRLLKLILLLVIGLPLFIAGMIGGFAIPGILVLLVIRALLPISTASRIICCGDDKFDNELGWDIRRKITDYSKRFLGYLYGQPIECD